MATTLTIEPSSAVLAWIGATERFTATIRDQNGNLFAGTIAWSSADPAVVAVADDGVATAIREGTTTIRAVHGNLAASANATVEQVPATLDVVSGAAQSGLFNSVLPEPVVVMVADSGGHAVADETVTFSPVEGSGTALPGTASTHVGGLASTIWTLGDKLGEQSLNIAVAGVPGADVLADALGPPLFPFNEIEVQRLDTTIVLRADATYGNSWIYETVESPWLAEHPVAEVKRSTDPAGLTITVMNPGSLQIKGDIGATQVLTVRVAPPSPIVYEVRQDSWPASDEITLRGYAVHRLRLPFLRVDDDPVLRMEGDSAEVVLAPSPLDFGACSGSHTGTATLAMGDALPAPDVITTVNRLKGPVTHLDTGESVRLGGGDFCLRLGPERDSRYVLAATERTYIDEALRTAEPNRYSGGDLYYWTMTDSSGTSAQAIPRTAAVRVSAPPLEVRSGYGDQIRSWTGPGSGVPSADGRTRAAALEPGDEFQFSTGGGRHGAYRVMGVYEPNVVLAAFVEDMDEIWYNKPSRQAEMDSLFHRLATPEVQDLYKTIFGPDPPRTNRQTGQMLVLYHRAFSATGRNDPNIDGDPRLSVIYVGHASWGDGNHWYLGLTAHELAHAWQFYNYGHFSSNWSGEGIANLFADEELRLRAGLPLDANVDLARPIQGSGLRLPLTGDFSRGYRESHPYLRFLVQRLVNLQGQSYDDAIHRVLKGAAEGWHGIHYVEWGRWNAFGRGPGLVGRMREVVPEWDPVESRLDWMIAFALDDRSPFDEYGNPFIADTWRHFGPWYDFEAGDGDDIWGDANLGGNHYYMLDNPRGIPVSIRHRITDGDPNMVWKIIRYR